MYGGHSGRSTEPTVRQESWEEGTGGGGDRQRQNTRGSPRDTSEGRAISLSRKRESQREILLNLISRTAH